MSFQIQYIYNLVDKVSPSLRKIQRNVKDTERKIAATANRASLSFAKMGQAIDATAKKSVQLGKSLFLKTTLPITLMGAAFVKAASDAEETSSKFATVFQDVGKQAENATNKLAKGYGLSSIKAKELLSDTGDLLTGFGFTGKMALDLSSRVNELAVDLASFTNFSGGAEGASKALTKALLGERESVKSLGISILEEDVKAKIRSLAATGELTGMTERQAKAYATLQIAISQSKNAIGDYSRTSQAFANRTRVLGQRFLDLKIKLGNLLLPVALKLVNLTIKLINKFNELSPATKKIILIIGGLIAVVAPLLIILGGAIIAFKAILIPLGLLFTSFKLLLFPAGLLATALKAIFVLIAANPISLLIIAIVALGIKLFFIIKKMKDMGIALADIPRLALDSFQRIFPNLIKPFDILIEKIKMVMDFLSNLPISKGVKAVFSTLGKMKDFAVGGDVQLGKMKDFAVGGDVQQTQEISKSIVTNNLVNNAQAQKQQFSVGGNVGIDIRGLPKGSSANLTPAPNNNIGVGLNSIFGT